MRSPLRQNMPAHQCAQLLHFIRTWLFACSVAGEVKLTRTRQAVLHTSGLHAAAAVTGLCMPLDKAMFPRLTKGCGLINWRACRYWHTMKKGSNAVETVRECAADLWRKGAACSGPCPRTPRLLVRSAAPSTAPLLPSYL